MKLSICWQNIDNRHTELHASKAIADLQSALAGCSLFVLISNNFALITDNCIRSSLYTSRMSSIQMPMRFGDSEGNDAYIPPRMGHLPYGPLPGSRRTVPPQTATQAMLLALGSQNHLLLPPLKNARLNTNHRGSWTRTHRPSGSR
jgi:hypothetical protein